MKTVTEQLNFHVAPAFATIFAKLAKLETDGGKTEYLKYLVREAASSTLREAVVKGILPPGTGCGPFVTGRSFDAALAKALTVLELKMAKAGDENDVQA